MDHKVALITGSTRGIGLGIASALAKEGYNLALNGIRDKQQVKEVIENLKKTGVNVIYCRGDIASSHSRTEMIKKVSWQEVKIKLITTVKKYIEGK